MTKIESSIRPHDDVGIISLPTTPIRTVKVLFRIQCLGVEKITCQKVWKEEKKNEDEFSEVAEAL